jgi:2'-5' RNA ligase
VPQRFGRNYNDAMRLFTAIDPSPEVRENLDRVLSRLRPTANLRWSRAENIHVTLKFIGEFPDAETPRLQEVLAALPFPEPFEIRVGGLGFFPNARAPRVFWVGVHAPPALAALAQTIEKALVPLGVESERRPYSPHLTLARIRDSARLDRFREELAALGTADLGTFRPDRFCLYHSRTGPGGSVYVKIEEYPWQR